MVETIQNFRSLAGKVSEAILDQISHFVATKQYQTMTHAERHDLVDGMTVVYLEGSHNSEMLNILEAHRKFIDLHYVLEGIDMIAIKPVMQCTLIQKEYDAVGDYILFSAEPVDIVTVKPGSSCFIPTNVAHMALYAGSSPLVKKLVFKIPTKAYE